MKSKDVCFHASHLFYYSTNARRTTGNDADANDDDDDDVAADATLMMLVKALVLVSVSVTNDTCNVTFNEASIFEVFPLPTSSSSSSSSSFSCR